MMINCNMQSLSQVYSPHKVKDDTSGLLAPIIVVK